MRADQQRVRSLLAEAITILCKNTLAYTEEFCVEGLLGITLDNNEVFLVNIKENVRDQGAANSVDPTTSLPPHLGMIPPGMMQANMPPPQRTPPMRAVPTSRPIPARSPFLPRRPTFGNRGRGRMRGKHPIRPPSRSPSGGPPVKRPAVASPPVAPPRAGSTDVVEVKDDEQETKPATDNGNDSQATATDNQQQDPLTALDFGDMMQQYEDTAPSMDDTGTGDDVDEGQEDDDTEQDTEQSNTPSQADANGAIVIKPEPGKDIPHSSCSQDQDSSGGAMFATPVDPANLFAATHSGPVFPGAMPPSAQFMDPTMPGYSGWGQQGTPTMPTPKRSGPGRPSAASGSPAQGSPSQARIHFICAQCGALFTGRWGLKQHIRTIHERSRLFVCQECGLIANQKSNMKQHIKRKHPSADVGTAFDEMISSRK